MLTLLAKGGKNITMPMAAKGFITYTGYLVMDYTRLTNVSQSKQSDETIFNYQSNIDYSSILYEFRMLSANLYQFNLFCFNIDPG